MKKGKFFLNDIYPYLGGEVEAKNVTTRADMTEEERRATPLSETQSTDAWIIGK